MSVQSVTATTSWAKLIDFDLVPHAFPRSGGFIVSCDDAIVLEFGFGSDSSEPGVVDFHMPSTISLMQRDEIPSKVLYVRSVSGTGTVRAEV
jgi:hypothetical protein